MAPSWIFYQAKTQTEDRKVFQKKTLLKEYHCKEAQSPNINDESKKEKMNLGEKEWLILLSGGCNVGGWYNKTKRLNNEPQKAAKTIIIYDGNIFYIKASATVELRSPTI
jgi:hypothetical protein